VYASLFTRGLICLFALVFLTGCTWGLAQDVGEPPTGRVTVETGISAGATTPVPVSSAVSVPTSSELPTAAPAASPTAVPAAKPARGTVGIDSAQDVPGQATEQLLQLLNNAGAKSEQVKNEADLRLTAEQSDGAKLAWERIFVPVDRMSSVLAGITLQELRDVWTGASTSANFATLYPDETLVPALTALLGAPGPTVKPQASAGLADAVWGDPMGLGIVPFESLGTRLRAIPLDDNSPTDNRFRATEWPLAARAYLAPLTERGQAALGKLTTPLPITNRDPNKLTVLVMTGVTAMARNSAVAIDRSGDPGFLARQVGPELAAADLTTTSNEISIFDGCVADNTLNNVLLCSKPAYWENLEFSGIDAIGLTGNHMNDFSYDNFRSTLQLYTDKQMPTYGGGGDDKAARKPLILEHNGNRLAFLGSNQWGPEWYRSKLGDTVSAWAGPDNPGALRFDQKQMVADIQAAKQQADVVFAEVQHTEFDAAGNYQVKPLPQEVADFQALSDGGADVVTGIMAHAPQAVELRDGREILYGLGNLYFDQTWSWPTRTGLVARHTIYDGKLINTELLVTVIQDNFQLRWATPKERMQVLRSVFDVSRW